MMDIEQARFNMVEQQIRTWDVLDEKVLNVLKTVKRELFVPSYCQELAFADLEIPLVAKQPSDKDDAIEKMLFPRMEGRILQELNLQGHERVLEIGTGSGYSAALLSHLTKKVVSLEINPQIAQDARQRLMGYANVEVIEADGSKGLQIRAPFDVIIVSGSVPVVPTELFQQLAIDGKLIAIVGTSPTMTLSLFQQPEPHKQVRTDILETEVLPYIKNVAAPKKSLI